MSRTYFLLILFVAGCNAERKESACPVTNGQIEVRLIHQKEYYALQSYQKTDGRDSLISTWTLPYPVYRFDCGDVNEDGQRDIMVGVEKATRFDSTVRKRLFIFKLFEGHIRPLWLGSSVSHPLVDFAFVKENSHSRILTVEHHPDGTYLLGLYRWRGFGLSFERYVAQGIATEEEAERKVRDFRLKNSD